VLCFLHMCSLLHSPVARDRRESRGIGGKREPGTWEGVADDDRFDLTRRPSRYITRRGTPGFVRYDYPSLRLSSTEPEAAPVVWSRRYSSEPRCATPRPSCLEMMRQLLPRRPILSLPLLAPAAHIVELVRPVPASTISNVPCW